VVVDGVGAVEPASQHRAAFAPGLDLCSHLMAGEASLTAVVFLEATAACATAARDEALRARRRAARPLGRRLAHAAARSRAADRHGVPRAALGLNQLTESSS
jgi:hypothetical protein